MWNVQCALYTGVQAQQCLTCPVCGLGFKSSKKIFLIEDQMIHITCVVAGPDWDTIKVAAVFGMPIYPKA